MRVKMLLVLVALLAVGSAAFGAWDVLWSEDFEGFALGDLLAQDATWSVTNPWGRTVVNNVNGGVGDINDWPLVDSQGGVFVHWSVAASGSEYTKWTKDVAIAPTENLIKFEYDMFASHLTAGFHAQQAATTIAKADGTEIVRFDYFRMSDVNYFQLNGVTFDNPAPGYPDIDYKNYAIDMDFDAQTASIAVNGVDQGVNVAFLTAAVPGDIGQVNLFNGCYYPGAARGYGTWVDNMSISQIPEPVTLSLLALGGIVAIRRRK